MENKTKQKKITSRKGEKEIKANWKSSVYWYETKSRKYTYQIVIGNNPFFYFRIIHFLVQ